MNRRKILNIVPDRSRNNSAATVKMAKALCLYTKNNVYREIFGEFYDFSDVGNYKLATRPLGIIFTGINPNITFPQMSIANVWEGGLRLQNKSVDLDLFSKKRFTVCIVTQFWLNRSLSLKTIISNGAQEKPHLIYDKTTKKLKLQTNGLRVGATNETSVTLLNSLNGKRVVFWLTKKGTGNALTVKASVSNYSSTLDSALASQSNYTFKIFSEDTIIHTNNVFSKLLRPGFYPVS